jgi:hypothetical protein
MFIDFLNLEKKDFSKNDLIIFYWKSWSWKSSYLNFFKKQKKYKNNIFLFHKKEKIIYKNIKQKYIFIDEIIDLKQFFIIFKYLLNWKIIFIASHIHPIFYKILFFSYKKNFYYTNKNNKKIEIFLKEKWYKFSKISIKKFLKKYDWNFISLQIMLNFYKEIKNFDQIFNLFETECLIRLKKIK